MLRAGVDGCLCKWRSLGETWGAFGTLGMAPVLLWGLVVTLMSLKREDGRQKQTRPLGRESFFHDLEFLWLSSSWGTSQCGPSSPSMAKDPWCQCSDCADLVAWAPRPRLGRQQGLDDGWLCVTVAVLQMLSAIELPAVI